MRIGIFGTGMVGEALASKCVARGHEVMMGSRSATGEAVRKWVEAAGEGAKAGSFQEAAAFGDLLFSCLRGDIALETVSAIDPAALAGKILIDVSNPLVAIEGEAFPSLKYGVDDSLGERIQAAFPETFVVKALNTLNCDVMVDPGRVAGAHNLFIAGNNDQAKVSVIGFLADNFGWPRDNVIDLGGISSARATELLMPLWMRLWQSAGHADFNWHIQGYRK